MGDGPRIPCASIVLAGCWNPRVVTRPSLVNDRGSVSLRSQLPSAFPPTMENELTFVAPEGVYSVTGDYRPIPAAHDALALNTIHSFSRVYVKGQPEPSQMSKEITVFPRNSESGAFSRPGDSGLAVIDGKCSAGSTDESDCAYLMVLTSVDFLCKRMLDHGIKVNLSPSLTV